MFLLLHLNYSCALCQNEIGEIHLKVAPTKSKAKRPATTAQAASRVSSSPSDLLRASSSELLEVSMCADYYRYEVENECKCRSLTLM